MKTNETNYLFCNMTGCDIRAFDNEIVASLKATGSLPEELADLFTVSVVQNPDGSPRYILKAA